MDICQSQLSRESLLNEQIADEIFDILPEDGPVVIIVDNSRRARLLTKILFKLKYLCDLFFKNCFKPF